jgi:CRISPR system Cascade subunit CasD
MPNRHLLLWLESPLQAWGHDSRFGRRDTLAFPTRSGVVGMLCCAMGAGGEQRELLSLFAPLEQTVIAYVRTRTYGKGQPQKMDREPLLRDFHMVGSGYDEDDPWQTLLIPKKSDGGKAVGGGTKMTYRYYLQDMAFAVVLETPEIMADEIADKLKNPVWDLYLGRKNCAPTDFIYRGLFDQVDAAITQAGVIAGQKNLAEDFRVLPGRHEGELLTLNDVPVQFGEKKIYRDRQVTVMPA